LDLDQSARFIDRIDPKSRDPHLAAVVIASRVPVFERAMQARLHGSVHPASPHHAGKNY